MQYLTLPKLALRLGRHQSAVRKAVDRLGVAVRIGPGYRLIPFDQIDVVRQELERHHLPRGQEVGGAT